MFSERLGAPVERIEYGTARAGRGRNTKKRKHHYRIVGRDVVVEVFGTHYITVNQNIYRKAEEALTAL